MTMKTKMKTKMAACSHPVRFRYKHCGWYRCMECDKYLKRVNPELDQPEALDGVLFDDTKAMERRFKLAQQKARVLKAAERWFAGRRPIGWSLALHLEQPQVNVATDNDKALATAVATLLREQRGVPKAPKDTKKLAGRRGK